MDAAELKDVMGRYRDLVYRIAYTCATPRTRTMSRKTSLSNS